MGRRSQFGSLDEVVSLCRDRVEGWPRAWIFRIFTPGRARPTATSSSPDPESSNASFAREALRDLRVHRLSGSPTTTRARSSISTWPDADFRFEEWIAAVNDMNAEGLVICESPAREHDAAVLKRHEAGGTEAWAAARTRGSSAGVPPAGCRSTANDDPENSGAATAASSRRRKRPSPPPHPPLNRRYSTDRERRPLGRPSPGRRGFHSRRSIR